MDCYRIHCKYFLVFTVNLTGIGQKLLSCVLIRRVVFPNVVKSFFCLFIGHVYISTVLATSI